ncbi:D-2-hydroxyacid dehydrogenase [Mycobacterium sp. URHB0044]|jgi:phosphoglycerate dehydrogenase-like enzyme|uniref:D-2-hydroxyacid dehydrogenase n=1 Tax=Mycobacterium sp. URHB0044 TaxID=1380386 RepID=UPI00056B7662|nr:D-2-hydroxyacid dehydrogenase [Mycobacterium sp. URHB0044]
MSRPNVAVIRLEGSVLPPAFAALEAKANIFDVSDERGLREAGQKAEIAFIWDFKSDLLRKFGPGDLRWIHTNSVGLDALLTTEIVDSAVTITNTRGVFEPPMAEWVLAAQLYFAKDLRRSVESQRAALWDHRAVGMIRGRRVLLLGPGGVGREIALLLRAVGMVVEIVGRSAREDAELGPIHALSDLQSLLPHADDVVVALPLTPETSGVVDAQFLAGMKPGSRLFNVGRGPLVDEDALLASLRSGHIAAAGLDVFVQEPLAADSPFWGMENVLVSPHMSGDVIGWQDSSVALFLDNLDRWRRGAPMLNVVDKRNLPVTTTTS